MSEIPDTPTPPTTPNPDQPIPPPPPRKKKRWWLRITLSLLLLIVVLILLGPMIASTAPVRSFVLGKVNQRLNGKAQIDDWSIGWTSGVDARGVKIDDPNGKPILQMTRVQAPLSLIDAIRGKYDLGKVVLEGVEFHLKIDSKGQSNLDRLARESKAADHEVTKGSVIKVPDVKVELVGDFHGTIEHEDVGTVYITDGKLSAKIDDINSPINNAVSFNCKVGDSGQPGSVSLAGTVDAFKNNQLDPKKLDTLKVDEKFDLKTLDLSAVVPILRKLAPDEKITVAGLANGALQVKATGTTDAAATGEIVVDHVVASAAAMKGDQYKTDKLTIPVNVTRTQQGTTGTVRIEQLGIKTSEATVAVNGMFDDSILNAIQEGKKIDSTGALKIVIDVPNLKPIADMLRNTLALQKGVEVTGGAFNQTTDITIKDGAIASAQKLTTHVDGTRDGKPVKISPVQLDSAATYRPSPNQKLDLRDIKLNLTSAFATITGGGETLAKTNIQGNFDLARLQQELVQFVDLDLGQLSGKGEFSVVTSTQGDPTSPSAINADTTMKLAANDNSPLLDLAANLGLLDLKANQYTTFNLWDPLESTCRHASLSIL